MFQPLKDRLVVKTDPIKEKTLDSGIILRAEDQEKPRTGVVLSIGSEVKDIAVGNKVIFGKHDGVNVKIDGENVLVMKENQIMAVICDS